MTTEEIEQDKFNIVAVAITEAVGARCPDFEATCLCCQSWAAFDAITQQSEKLEAEVLRLRSAMADLYQCDEWGVFSQDEVKDCARAALNDGGDNAAQ